MEKETKENLHNWSLNNNGHPKDDERLYEIVMSTLNEKISENDFLKIVKKSPKLPIVDTRIYMVLLNI